MYIAWTKHIKDPAEKTRLESQIRSAKPVLDRLRQLMLEDEIALDRSELDIKTFESPNWEYKQAFKNGYRSHMALINKLTDLDQQENK